MKKEQCHLNEKRVKESCHLIISILGSKAGTRILRINESTQVYHNDVGRK